MIKKTNIVISSLIMAVIFTLGTIPVLGASETSTGTMGLDTVIRKTIDDNPSLRLYYKKISVSKSAAIEAKRDRGNETKYQEDMRLNVNPERRVLELDNLQWEKDEKEASVVNESKQYYYQSIIQDQLIEIQKSKIKRLEKALEDKKLGIDVGTEAQTSLIDDQVNLNQAQTALQQLMNDKENVRMKLNINMGVDVDADINLTPVDVPYEEFTVKDIGALAIKMSKEYHSVKSMDRELILDNIESGIADKYDDDKNQLERAGSPNTDYKSYAETLDDNIIDLGYSIADESRSINAKVRMDYNNILNLNNIALSKKLDYDKAQILYNVEITKFNVGMSTQMNCDAASETLKAATCEYNKAKLDYFIGVEQFKIYTKGII